MALGKTQKPAFVEEYSCFVGCSDKGMDWLTAIRL